MLPDTDQTLPKLSCPHVRLSGPATSNRHSAVGVVSTLRSGSTRNRCAIPGNGKSSFCFSKVPTSAVRPTQPPIQTILRGGRSVPANKPAGSVQLTIHLPSSTDFQNAWSLPPFPPEMCWWRTV